MKVCSNGHAIREKPSSSFPDRCVEYQNGCTGHVVTTLPRKPAARMLPKDELAMLSTSELFMTFSNVLDILDEREAASHVDYMIERLERRGWKVKKEKRRG